jgi:hypothetical protein
MAHSSKFLSLRKCRQLCRPDSVAPPCGPGVCVAKEKSGERSREVEGREGRGAERLSPTRGGRSADEAAMTASTLLAAAVVDWSLFVLQRPIGRGADCSSGQAAASAAD